MKKCDCLVPCEICECGNTLAPATSSPNVAPSTAILAKKAVKQLTPVQAIRAKCLECSGSSKEVKLCTVKSCALMPYRLGHRPVKGGEPCGA